MDRDFFWYIKDRIQGKAPKGAKRNKDWRKLRKKFRQTNDVCAVCGTKKKLEVHHVIPFHVAPELELDMGNLITLCDGGGRRGSKSCHLLFGHLGNWQNANTRVKEDATIWRHRLK